MAIDTDADRFLAGRVAILEEQLAVVEALAAADQLPDATMTGAGHLRLSPLTNAVPDEADALIRATYGVLPHVKITELLLEVDRVLPSLHTPQVRAAAQRHHVAADGRSL